MPNPDICNAFKDIVDHTVPALQLLRQIHLDHFRSHFLAHWLINQSQECRVTIIECTLHRALQHTSLSGTILTTVGERRGLWGPGWGGGGDLVAEDP